MSLEVVEGKELSKIISDNNIEIKSVQLAVGLKIPTSVKTPVRYIGDLRKYSDLYNDIYQQMEVCNKLYKYNPIIGNAVDVLVDFAVTGLEFEPTGDKKLDTLLEFWFRNVNRESTNTQPGMSVIAEELALEHFTSGNAFPYAKWQNVSITNNEKNVYKLPMNISLINPQSITIPTGPIAFGQEVIMLKYDGELVAKIKGDGRTSPESALIKQAVPRSIINAIKKNSFIGEGIRLNPKYITHLKRRAKGYQAWGVPYLTRILTDAALMDRIRELDDSVTSGLLNLITIFKIGTEEHPASPARLRKFAALLANPKATTTLVWAHDIEVIQVGPDGKVLAYSNKYKDIKENILIALGIPPVLMALPSQGNEWVSILALVERLVGWRSRISLWVEGIADQIIRFNDLKPPKQLKVSWERMNLVDEQAVKNLTLAFYDRGLISIKTALKESDHEIEAEKTSKKEESQYQDLFAPPNLPFSGKKEETEKKRPLDSDETQTKKTVDTKTDQTVDLKQQKKKSEPKKQ